MCMTMTTSSLAFIHAALRYMCCYSSTRFCSVFDVVWRGSQIFLNVTSFVHLVFYIHKYNQSYQLLYMITLGIFLYKYIWK